MTKKFPGKLKNIMPILVVIVLLSISVFIFSNNFSISIDENENYQMTNKTDKGFTEVYKDGISPAILLIHGFGGSPIDLKPMIEAIEKKGYAFKAIMLPGHGTSPRDLKDIKMDEWLNKTFSEYESLKNKHGEVSLVGFSMGGAISLFVAAEKNVSKLVLISPYFKVKEQWYYFGKPERWAQRVGNIIPFVKKLKIGQINDPEGLKRYNAYKYLPMKTMSELAKTGRIAKEKAKQVKCETLWIHSKSDIVADFQLSKEVFDSLPVNKKNFIEYNKSNHIILYDYDSKDAIKRIMLFLEGKKKPNE